MTSKTFKLSAAQIAPIALGRGACLATDRIVVDGCPVGYMVREATQRPQDSGWRFFAGDEDEAYMQDVSLHGVYDVNTLVNYDPSILDYLDMAVGTRLERDDDGAFVLVE